VQQQPKGCQPGSSENEKKGENICNLMHEPNAPLARENRLPSVRARQLPGSRTFVLDEAEAALVAAEELRREKVANRTALSTCEQRRQSINALNGVNGRFRSAGKGSSLTRIYSAIHAM
jgi:hypothetical protein